MNVPRILFFQNVVDRRNPGFMGFFENGVLHSIVVHPFLVTIWLFNIAMENGPFIDGLPIENGDFPCLC